MSNVRIGVAGPWARERMALGCSLPGGLTLSRFARAPCAAHTRPAALAPHTKAPPPRSTTSSSGGGAAMPANPVRRLAGSSR